MHFVLQIEDGPDVLFEKCQRLALAIKQAKSLVIYTGAGISTVSVFKFILLLMHSKLQALKKKLNLFCDFNSFHPFLYKLETRNQIDYFFQEYLDIGRIP